MPSFYMMPCEAAITLNTVLVVPYGLATTAARVFRGPRSRLGLHIV